MKAYPDRGRNIEPSINTDPDSRIYQQLITSPDLEKKKTKISSGIRSEKQLGCIISFREPLCVM
ncbi:hypothetical protein BpHYR1_021855 [Brachionus plicatilis]|uniref:Uncharacterized protein n=1 Tax=Brachionus plicatilis TaxID=10195 RepID=A0A3M7T468_BRAPC|nr:hypothetical protein BpHYR1_021855 [Brachionus plicatilis]